MSRVARTRLFLFISVGVLLVGLGTGLIASYVGLQNVTMLGFSSPPPLPSDMIDALAALQGPASPAPPPATPQPPAF